MDMPETSELGYLDRTSTVLGSYFLGGMLGAARSFWGSIFNGGCFKTEVSAGASEYGIDSSGGINTDNLPKLADLLSNPFGLSTTAIKNTLNSWFEDLTGEVYSYAQSGSDSAWRLLDEIAWELEGDYSVDEFVDIVLSWENSAYKLDNEEGKGRGIFSDGRKKLGEARDRVEDGWDTCVDDVEGAWGWVEDRWDDLTDLWDWLKNLPGRTWDWLKSKWYNTYGDKDGDGLCFWKEEGLGGDYEVKDLFIEVDWLSGCRPSFSTTADFDPDLSSGLDSFDFIEDYLENGWNTHKGEELKVHFIPDDELKGFIAEHAPGTSRSLLWFGYKDSHSQIYMQFLDEPGRDSRWESRNSFWKFWEITDPKTTYGRHRSGLGWLQSIYIYIWKQ